MLWSVSPFPRQSANNRLEQAAANSPFLWREGTGENHAISDWKFVPAVRTCYLIHTCSRWSCVWRAISRTL